ncbi:TWiK family of potassium channels protein 7 [Portunus trituberculatus]|uniref:TWiK family of potassium channels protein 7 n=1 Tax=Portunus trituberculatus TaxID=210409 RepID=A0A5B7D8S6_PORTR|nr:TWiK family of potassium channels protein 7 [Portunus trituberculatus]
MPILNFILQRFYFRERFCLFPVRETIIGLLLYGKSDAAVRVIIIAKLRGVLPARKPAPSVSGAVGRQGKFVMSDTLVSDKSGCCKRVARVLFSHIGLLVLVALYAVLGAYLFIAVEEGHEEKLRQNKKRVSLDLIDAKNYIVNLLVYNRDKNITKTKYIDMVMEKLDLFHDFVVDKASDPDINYDGDENSWDTAWTFPKSLLFTVTTMGSIGYGHIAPKTTAGRQITILYSVVGIPLLLVFLANIGMALVSMCISLMQEQLVQKTRWLLTEIGIMEEDIDPMQKYKYKKSQKGTVLETHKDRDGNKRLRLLSVDEGESSAFRPPVSIDIKDENER